MTILQRILGSSLLWLFMRARSSNYIFFSLVVKSAHKMLSLTVSLRVRRLQVQNGFQALSDGLNPAGKMTLDQFNTIFSAWGGHFRGLQRWICQTHGARLCLPKMIIHFLHNTATNWASKKLQIWSTFSWDHISFLSSAVSQPWLTLIYLYKSFIVANEPELLPAWRGFIVKCALVSANSIHIQLSAAISAVSALMQATFEHG